MYVSHNKYLSFSPLGGQLITILLCTLLIFVSHVCLLNFLCLYFTNLHKTLAARYIYIYIFLNYVQ